MGLQLRGFKADGDTVGKAQAVSEGPELGCEGRQARFFNFTNTCLKRLYLPPYVCILSFLSV